MSRSDTPASNTRRTVPPRPTRTRARILTLAGQPLAAGIVEVSGSDRGWVATLSALDRPGRITGAYFATGLRDVVVLLDDGRRARARIASTSFAAENERVFQLRGLAGFATAS